MTRKKIDEPAICDDWHEPTHMREDPVQRARDAETLLSNPLLQNAFETVRRAYEQQWIRSKRTEAELREIAYYSLTALKDVEQAIRVHIHNGRIIELNTKLNKV